LFHQQLAVARFGNDLLDSIYSNFSVECSWLLKLQQQVRGTTKSLKIEESADLSNYSVTFSFEVPDIFSHKRERDVDGNINNYACLQKKLHIASGFIENEFDPTKTVAFFVLPDELL